MALPYSFKKFYETDFSQKKFLRKIQKKEYRKVCNSVFFDENVIFVKFNSPLCCSGSQLKIKFTTNGFFYEFSTNNLISVSIIMIIIEAFIFKTFHNLLIISIFTFLIFFILGILHSISYLENFFDKICEKSEPTESLTDEQKEWLKNPDKCPACGYDLSPYDTICPDCGLNLSKHRKPKAQPVSRTGFENYFIKYTYKKRNDKNRS